MRSHLITGIVAALAAVGAMMLAEPDPMSQASFPCHEDEVLSYSPRFGPDRVGCLHTEEIKP